MDSASLAVTEKDRAQAREVLLGLLANETDSTGAERLAVAVVGLAPVSEDHRQMRRAPLRLLSEDIQPDEAR